MTAYSADEFPWCHETVSATPAAQLLQHIKDQVLPLSPRGRGILRLVCRRPSAQTTAREVLVGSSSSSSGPAGWLVEVGRGLQGDSYMQRGSRKTADGSPHPDAQIAAINSRVAEFLVRNSLGGGVYDSMGEGDRHRAWGALGDQLYLDLDITGAGISPGTRVLVGTDAVLEVTTKPHTGCPKFEQRLGSHTLELVKTEEGLNLRLRGIYFRVITPGIIKNGDPVVIIE
ncbi:GNAT family N-acetyltransferase [Pelomyxa schiedti]|nr:GNAT family N-acetyltransferase [Pelomyxa schiedti]